MLETAADSNVSMFKKNKQNFYIWDNSEKQKLIISTNRPEKKLLFVC